MTAFWDSIRKEVTEARSLDDASFLEAVIEIEARVVQTVSLVTGDREFPDDLREKIQGIIACNAIDIARGRGLRATDALPPNERARGWLLTMRYSIMLEELHAIFHVVASRKPTNRFDGFFTDDPSVFLRAREAALG